MPYINPKSRKSIASGRPPLFAGELNYCITLRLLANDDEGVDKLMFEYWERGPKTYQVINDVLGAFAGACLEYEHRTKKMVSEAACEAAYWFYQRVVRPYEDAKIKENGDVYPREQLPKRN